MPLTALMVTKQARKYHKELNIEDECEYSEELLQKFRKRHSIKYLKICGEKVSADCNSAECYIDKFAKIVSDKNLSPEHICNADETALYWLCTLPLSHPVPYIILSKKNFKIFHSKIKKSVWSQAQVFG